MAERKLNHKEQKFVDAVAKGVGHEQAAIYAGYSPKSARTLAARLLQNVAISIALEKRREYFRSIANVEAADIIGAQVEIAFATIEDAHDENGRFDYQKAVKTGAAKLIRKISRQYTKFGETVAVEFYSRTDALGQLTDILGLKQMPKENAETVAKVLSSFNLWLEKNPNANVHQKADAIRDFATFGKVDERELGKLAGVDIQQIETTQ